MVRLTSISIWALALTLVMTTPGSDAAAEPGPTFQRKVAQKDSSIYAHLTASTHLRNDFYDTFGFGADGGYYPTESLGIELRWVRWLTTLNETARNVKDQTGLTPDARPQDMLFAAGLRYSIGYGKMLLGKKSLVHFDPQLVVQGGATTAESRILPTGIFGVSLLTHFRWGIQAKLDLNLTVQSEKRDRGTVMSIGFSPILAVGWHLRRLPADAAEENR
jgi:outer membrane beta-barrel protein